jgi:hypothetical protein
MSFLKAPPEFAGGAFSFSIVGSIYQFGGSNVNTNNTMGLGNSNLVVKM